MTKCGWLIACGLLGILLQTGESRGDDLLVGPRALSRAFREAARRATPSVVTIVTYGQQQNQEGENPQDVDPNTGNERLPATGLGSGVIIDAAGVVLTNNHVVRDATRVIVKLQDGTELQGSSIVGDPDSDLATLKVESRFPLTAAAIGDSEALEIGDWVLAIGSPFQLEATVSAGIISAKERTLPGIRRAELLQTDAVINPGNSGGPLINLDGEVVGISTAIATRNGVFQGIGFAIPTDQAKWIADELLEHGKVRRAKMGISLAELTRPFADRLQLEPDSGVVAYQVAAGSAAEEAGIEPLDVIVEFAGNSVRNPAELRRAIERRPVGSTQPVTIVRKGERRELQVVLRPVDGE